MATATAAGHRVTMGAFRSLTRGPSRPVTTRGRHRLESTAGNPAVLQRGGAASPRPPVVSDRRRVCVVGSGWQFTSGISYYTCRLVEAFEAERFAVTALLMRRLVPRRLYPGRDRVGAPVSQLGYPSEVPVFDGVDWFWFPSIVRAIRFLRRQRPEILILQWWTGAVLHSYLLIALVAKALGASVVIEFHETQDTGEARLAGASGYLNRIGRLLIACSSAFVVHSEFDRRQVQAMFDLAGKPIRVLPHGPFDHHLPAAETSGSTPGRGATTRILFFGTIRPYKGLELLVSAFDGLPDQLAAGLELVVVGETWEGWTEPLHRIETSPRRDRITLVNRYVTDEEVGRFFADADVVALPYRRSSASGPLHIAMAHGLPIVLTDVGGLREGAAGYEGISWAPPDDVAGLAAALVDAVGRVGERYADPRSWQHTVGVYADLFAELDS